MASDDIASLTYLSLLLLALLSWAIVHHRHSIGSFFQQMAAWAFIFIGTVAAVGLWSDIRQTVLPSHAAFTESGEIALRRAADGHYYATLDANGTPVRFVVDTGASGIVLSREDAERIGLPMDKLAFFGEAMTANGPVRTAPVKLDSLALGPVVDRDVAAFVNAGRMENSLLGMSYLQRYSRIEISGNQLLLER